MRLEVELEAEGARAVAGEVGEGDDEVLEVGGVGVLRDVECEGDVGGAGAGLGFRVLWGGAAAGGEARAVGCVAVVCDREADGEVGRGGVDLVGRGWLEG